MKQILKLGVVLALYSVVSCFMLALVNAKTGPIIEKAKLEKQQKTMKEVFSAADSFETETWEQEAASKIKVDMVALAKKEGNTEGVVLQLTGPTYDTSTILVGIDRGGIVTGVRFMSTSDSPGFGQNATKPEFYQQFEGKDSKLGFAAGQTFNALSGATITSNGVANILNYATKVSQKVLETQGGN